MTSGVDSSSTKFVLVSGGVISGIGKGLTASSIGVLLKSCGYRVTSIKIDPYLNVDAGTMSPFEHGEVFVLDDGGEADLDLGNYERFLDVRLTRDNNITTGKIYQRVIDRERRGDYLGKTVQVIPHITDEIMRWIRDVASTPAIDRTGTPEICLIELGGTVGDIESMPFIEALRQLRYEVGQENFCSVFVSLVPIVGVVGEQKTKPTQHGVKNLTSMGLSPQLIVCRSEQPLLPDTKKKLGLFCQVEPQAVVSVHDLSNIYNIPLLLQEQGVCNLIIKSLHLVWKLPTLLERWDRMAKTIDRADGNVKIALVGKYTEFSDAYLSVVKALTHAGMATSRSIEILWVESTDLEQAKETSNGLPSSSPRGSPESPSNLEGHDSAWEKLKQCDGILVPGGFGDRGIEGMILAAQYARETKKPYLGICLGMQLAAVEIARSKLGWTTACSEEFNAEADPKVVVFMPEGDKANLGGTMRLGSRRTILRQPECLAGWLYGATEIWERHRHRYEVNPDIVGKLEEVGLLFVGQDETGKRMEVLEIENHPFFLGTQFHPEFTSRPGRPSPPFLGLVMASAGLPLDKVSVEETVRQIRHHDPWIENE